MEEYSKNEIVRSLLASLDKKVTEGFLGVHTRQDKTNGNVIKNTEFRIQAETAISLMKWAIGVLGIGNIASIIYFISKGG